jgi:hypothetical protein
MHLKNNKNNDAKVMAHKMKWEEENCQCVAQ